MVDTNTASHAPLEAKSPFDLRVNLSKNVAETDVRSALDNWRHGLPPFVHDRFDRRWPGRTRSGVDGRLCVALSLLP